MEQKTEVIPVIPMPVKATPYKHQIEAFNLAMRLFGVAAGNAACAAQAHSTARCELEQDEVRKSKYYGERK
jgi:hypothetical protein